LSSAASDASRQPLLPKKEGSKSQAQGSDLPATRRGAFKVNVERIQTELAAGDVRLAALQEPPSEYVNKTFDDLVGNISRTKKDAPHHEDPEAAIQDPNMDSGYQRLFNAEGLQGVVSHHGTAPDDGTSIIAADDYLAYRIQPQLALLSQLSRSHEWKVNFLQTLVFLGTAVNAVSAVLKMDYIMPLLVAMTSSLSALSDFHMYPMRLVSVNGAISELRNLIIWWHSLSMVEQRQTWAKNHLVEVSESVIDADLVTVKKKTTTRQAPGEGGNDDDDNKKKADKEDADKDD